jgi:hypothetical protein
MRPCIQGFAMRLRIVTAFLCTGFLCAGMAAFGQSVAPAPARTEPHPTAPLPSAGQGFIEQFLAPPANIPLNQPPLIRPLELHAEKVAPQRKVILAPNGDVQIRDKQFDSRIIVRPPQSSLGEQPPGKEVAQNQYPGLMLLPIQESKAIGLPIPTTWPNMKVENIPTHWQQNVIKPAMSSLSGSASPGKPSGPPGKPLGK